MVRKILMYVYDENYEVGDVNGTDEDIGRLGIIEKILIEKYEDIKEDIIRRSDKEYYILYN